MRRLLPLTALLWMLVASPLWGQTITRVEYFVDDDPGRGQATAFSITPGDTVDASEVVDLNALSDGLHRLYVRAQDANGAWGHTQVRPFWKEALDTSTPVSITEAEYFIDDDPGRGQASPIDVTPGLSTQAAFTVDLAPLSSGLHRLYVRARDAEGVWSHVQVRPFWKEEIERSTPAEVTRAEFFFDTDPGRGQGTPIDLTAGPDTEASFIADLSTLSEGLHRLYVRVQDETGRWSLTAVRPFWIQPVPSATDRTITRVEYFIDDDPGKGQATPATITPAADVASNVVVDLSTLSEGLHRLYVRAQNETGDWSLTAVRPFWVQRAAETTERDITRVEYYIDEDPGTGNGTPVPLTPDADLALDFVVDLGGVSDGHHELFVRAQDETGAWSPIVGPHPFTVGNVIQAISPQRGGNTGTVTATLAGLGFTDGDQVTLTGGGATIEADPETVAFDQSTITAVFDLEGQPEGVYDVVVTGPGGTRTLDDAFTVEQGRAADVWVDILGRNAIRPGRPQTFTIQYGNRGNVDALMTPIVLEIPKGSEWELNFDLTPVPILDDQDLIDPQEVPTRFETNRSIVLPYVRPIIPGNSSSSFDITITPNSGGRFSIKAWAAASLLENGSTLENVKSARKNTKCGAEIANVAVAAALAAGPGCAASYALTAAGFGTTAVSLAATDPDGGSGSGIWYAAGGMFAGLAGLVFTSTLCPLENATPVGAVTRSGTAAVAGAVSYAGLGLAGASFVDSCGPEEVTEREVDIITSIDPNEKVGSSGAGEANYLSGEEPLRYAIYFENLDDASAPAQEVFITDTLDTARLDLSTFSIGPIAWGEDRRVVPPPGLSSFTEDVDLRPEHDLILRIQANLNKTTGIARWTFRSLDPDTGELTQDPFAGFLPPNVNAPEGEGRVLFTVSPKDQLSTGTAISNEARIVFDLNEPIDTPVWTNTIDNEAPTSAVTALAPIQTDSTFTVQWSGADQGAGILNYTVFVSRDGGPFTRWLINTPETEAAFTADSAETYAFASLARDATGNWEPIPDDADTATRVDPAPPAPEVFTATPRTAPSSGPPQVTLSWQPSSDDVARYRLYRGTTATFDTTNALIAEPTAPSYTDTTAGVGQTYYYRVMAIDAAGTGSSLSDVARAFLYPSTVSARFTRSFGDATTPQSYQLVALPGASNQPLGDALPGEGGADWQAFWDNGSAQDYFVQYDDSETFTFGSGRGFWLIGTRDWTVDAAYETVSLQGDTVATVRLHDGWNIISNPLDKDVAWRDVAAANGDTLQTIWHWDGTFTASSTFRSAKSGAAYYFLNDRDLSTLIIPYPGAPGQDETQSQNQKVKEKLLTLSAYEDNTLASSLQVGLLPDASEGIDAYDQFAPPGQFAASSLRSKSPQAEDARQQHLAIEYRPSKGEGQTFNLQLRSASGIPTRLVASGLNAFANHAVALIDQRTGRAYDMHATSTVSLQSDSESTAYKLAIGTDSYVENEKARSAPKKLELFPNYPNPFGGRTTLEYALPERADVRIVIFDILGRRVRVLHDENRRAGFHQLQWNGRNNIGQPVASGLYLVRLEALGQQKTQKITLVR